MAKRKGLLTAEEFKKRYSKEVRSLGDAIKFSIEKYKRLLANWTKATAKELFDNYIGGDTCALCHFCDDCCSKCPLLLRGSDPWDRVLSVDCFSCAHPYNKMWANLMRGRKARAREYAEEILRILKKKARKIH